MEKCFFRKKNLTAVLFSSVVFLSLICGCKEKPTAEQLELERLEKIERAKENAIDLFVASMTDDIKLSQLFLVNIEGNQKFRSVEKKSELSGPFSSDSSPLVPGGVLLFSYNISKDPLETAQFIKSIRDFYIENGIVPPYVAVDQEGGLVNRLRGLTSPLWSQKQVAANFSAERAEDLYSFQARQMAQLGIHMNLAPVVEVENASNSAFLDTRTFGSLENVLAYGKAEISGFEDNGIATVLKHFPGNSGTDPHTGLPELKLTFSELKDEYFAPFEKLLPSASAVLMSHARISLVQSGGFPEEADRAFAGKISEEQSVPACLSEFWVSQVVRKNFGFEGLIFSDDIFMGALADNGFPPEVAAVKAIEAGVDVIMLSEKRFAPVARIFLEKIKNDAEFAKKIDCAVKDVVKYKIKAGILLLEENVVEDGSEEVGFRVSVNHDHEFISLDEYDACYRGGMDLYR